MSKINQKIPAFTIAELIIVMALSTLIFGIGGTAYNLVQQQQIHYEQRTDEALEINDFITLYQKDWVMAKTVFYDNDIYQFTFPNYQIAYQLEENLIIRHNDQVTTVIDTFRLKVLETENYFNNQYAQNRMIDRSTITFSLYEQPYTITFQKQYSAADLMDFAGK